MVVNHETHDPALQLDPAWQYSPPPDAPMPLRLRIPLLLLVTLGHLGVFWVFDRSGFVMPPERAPQETTLVFLEPPPAPEPEPEPEPVPVPEPAPEARDIPPEPEPAPEPTTEPVPEPEPEPEPEPVQEPLPPAPEDPVDPEPTPEPVEPMPEPPPDAVSASVPGPEAPPAPEPIALPDPAIVRQVVDVPAPERIEVEAPPSARPSPAEIDVVLPPDVPPPSLAASPGPARETTVVADVAPVVKRKKPRLDPLAVEAEAAEEALAAADPSAADAVDAAPPAPADDFSMPPAGGALQAVDPSPRPGGSLQLFRADGSLDLPDEVREQLGAVEDDGRGFSFQQPGLMAAGSFLRRQPALVYEPTVFDEYWIPEKDVLTALLERAVEATTGTVEVPIPGSPGSKLVCSVSILAAGGACGIRNNNDGQVVGLDDPDTLNPEEARQCEAWWKRIVEATEESAWRGTRKLYDAQCRKPLERSAPDVPMPRGG